MIARLYPRVLAVAITGLLVIGVASVAFASIPDTNGVIHGCRRISGGALRVINYPTQRCNPDTERRLDWNRTGPPGPAGVLEYVTVVEEEGIPAAAASDTIDTVYHPDADCPTGDIPITAGWEAFNTLGSVVPTFVHSKPVQHTWRWGIRPGPAAYTFRMHLVCAATS